VQTPALYREGEGEQLVLVHGFTATWRCWLPVADRLAQRFEVIAPTLHGHDGGPEPPVAARSITHAADHFELLLDELGVGVAHLAGNSMGGALALELAKRGRARSVVAISPGGGWREEDAREPRRIIRQFKLNQRAARMPEKRAQAMLARPRMRRLAMRDVMTRGDNMPPAEAVQMVRSSTRCSVVDDVFETIRDGSARVVDLDRVGCPVLLAWGDRDRILPLKHHAGRFREEIPGAEFRVLEGLGHTPMWDDPDVVAATIGDFAARAAAQSATTASASPVG
jgi:pimeloyl-ACP methyl ester carboxylesterase